ncbi:MAG TPA: DUF6807 family protein [Gemmataceae bacterium]
MKKVASVLAAWLAALGAATAADPLAYEITVTGGPHDLKNVPVCAPVTILTGALSQKTGVVLKDASGKDGPPCELALPYLHGGKDVGDSSAMEICFVLPELAAGEVRKYTAMLSDDPELAKDRKPGFSMTSYSGQYRETRFEGKLVARYMCRDFDDSTPESRFMTYKPFHHIFDPETGTQLTAGPEAGMKAKFPHHRGLFFGFNRISYGGKKADVWHCTGDAHQRHEGYGPMCNNPVLDRMTATISWRGPGKEAFAYEERQVTFYRPTGEGMLIDFASRVESNVDVPVKLDGDPQHAGVQFRASHEVADKTFKQTYYLRPDGKGKPDETRNWDPKTGKGPENLPWNALCCVIGGKRYTVVYLDHPENPKPARYSERNYGRFGSYFEYTLTKDKPLRVKYRLWIQPGEMTVGQCEALSSAFTDPPKVTVKAVK